jgi:hypothetical protein
MNVQSNFKKIWQVEITFHDTKPPHLYLMTNFTNNIDSAVDQLKRQVKWFKPETIKSAKAVQYVLEAVDEVDYTDSLHALTVTPIEGE